MKLLMMKMTVKMMEGVTMIMMMEVTIVMIMMNITTESVNSVGLT